MSSNGGVGLTGGIGKGMVLVGDDPSPLVLAQPERDPEALSRLLGELLRRSSAQQGVRVRDVLAGGDVQRLDLEHGAWACHSKKGGQTSR